jgi:hypothetical protein
VTLGAKSECLGTRDAERMINLTVIEEQDPNASGPCVVAEMGAALLGRSIGGNAIAVISEGIGDEVENRTEGSKNNC